MEKRRKLKLVETERRRNYLLSESNFEKKTFRKLISNRNQKIKLEMKKTSLFRSLNFRY